MPPRKSKKRPRPAEKPYKHPIPSRNELIQFLERAGRPLKVKEIIDGFDLKGERMRTLLEECLEIMHRAGQIIENRRREYCLTAKLDLVTGTVSGHPDGFGFVVRDDGEGDDIYLSAREMRSLFHGDRVVIRVVCMYDGRLFGAALTLRRIQCDGDCSRSAWRDHPVEPGLAQTPPENGEA